MSKLVGPEQDYPVIGYPVHYYAMKFGVNLPGWNSILRLSDIWCHFMRWKPVEIGRTGTGLSGYRISGALLCLEIRWKLAGPE